MKADFTQIDRIFTLIEKLLKKNEELKKEVSGLKVKADNLSQIIENQEKIRNDLEVQIKIIKLAKSISQKEVAEKASLKRNINEYIREIDDCIAMLNDD